jgi:hypothetical protein
MSITFNFITGVSLGFEIVDGEVLDEDGVSYAIVVDLFIIRLVLEKFE